MHQVCMWCVYHLSVIYDVSPVLYQEENKGLKETLEKTKKELQMAKRLYRMPAVCNSSPSQPLL